MKRLLMDGKPLRTSFSKWWTLVSVANRMAAFENSDPKSKTELDIHYGPKAPIDFRS